MATLARAADPADEAAAIRLALVVALDCASVAACLGHPSSGAGAIWPSTLYAWAAEAATRSPTVWRRVARALDGALAPWLGPYRDASLATIAEALSARAALAIGPEETAAALWALARRRDPHLRHAIGRLAGEAEILVVRASTARART